MSTMTVSAMPVGAMTVGATSPGVRSLRAAPTTPPRESRAPVRLTRRGRLLASLLVLLLAVAAAVLLTGGATALAGSGGGSAPVAERVTVRPGETLWQIAERTAPGTDPRETVQRILDLNGLQTSQVRAGTALQLP